MFGSCGDDNCLWLIILLILFSCCGCGNEGMSRGGCGCGGDSGSFIWIILILVLCGGCGCNNNCPKTSCC